MRDEAMRGIAGWIEKNAEKYPDRRAFADPDHSVTWQDYFHKACRIGAYVWKRGMAADHIRTDTAAAWRRIF